jgi:hypothetical protein
MARTGFRCSGERSTSAVTRCEQAFTTGEHFTNFFGSADVSMGHLR